ncbi:MAG: glycine cleavage system protein GcvH [Acidobacteria bacterium]|nr:glycine cleavage system protein GcvH [Acidobacteriota bacterium]MYD69938.1 glycine cleavage system protein GcvH [Acidobacteriota bacterium]MYJ05331.1 glycine cleavage system protein GcvH [Acidobacteriota bacterium]
MSYPTDLRYTKDHEWIRIEGETGRIGVTDYAQQQLGDVVFVDLPEPGATLTKGEQFGSIESVKAVSDLYAPMSGRVVEVNGTLQDQPESVNQDPHGAWMVSIAVDDPSQADDLMDADGYRALIGVA